MKCKTGKINKNKIILWNKEVGETSFYSLGKIKKLLGTKKVGHTGTLDKFAHGLMIVLSGKLTRLKSLFSSMDKSYIAEITFGKETDTLDPTGNVLYEAPVPEQETVINTLSGFMGLQHQIPPMYSAIHVDGKRAWKRALDGENIEMKPRTIRIDQLKVIHWIDNTLRIEIHCSKGTYIRSFARDLAISCNSRAHLTALQRISVGFNYISTGLLRS
jgi:tRNA pseudouridine55 synthase